MAALHVFCREDADALVEEGWAITHAPTSRKHATNGDRPDADQGGAKLDTDSINTDPEDSGPPIWVLHWPHARQMPLPHST